MLCPWLSTKFKIFIPIIKNSHILAGIYFIFLKNVLDQN